jgi:APA family basic amino acid/polyamine antiporter
MNPTKLRRELGIFGALMLGLGAMIGTGVFVSIGLGAGVAGPAVLLALALAAGVALCNGLSSAQLAANHPVSGGTYEYGYVYLNSWAGFTAGWVFLIAKGASAATAMLGFSAYLLHAVGFSSGLLVPVALGATTVLTIIVLAGIRRSNTANIAIVGVTLTSLAFFVVAGLPHLSSENLTPFFREGNGGMHGLGTVLEATALMFVAYTGYARIATLGEEVREPRRTIPRAIILSALTVMLIYSVVAVVAIGVVGPEALSAATAGEAAPLAVVAERFSPSLSVPILVVGALTAMLGVALNLILGLSRVVLAMARRGDLVSGLARLNAAGTTPHFAVIAVAGAIAALILIGDVRTTWSFSAFAVLVYYALTNLAALRLAAEDRLYPRWISWLGLVCSLGLAFWVEPRVWMTGLVLIVIGLVWHAVAGGNIGR